MKNILSLEIKDIKYEEPTKEDIEKGINLDKIINFRLLIKNFKKLKAFKLIRSQKINNEELILLIKNNPDLTSIDLTSSYKGNTIKFGETFHNSNISNINLSSNNIKQLPLDINYNKNNDELDIILDGNNIKRIPLSFYENKKSIINLHNRTDNPELEFEFENKKGEKYDILADRYKDYKIVTKTKNGTWLNFNYGKAKLKIIEV